MGCMSCDADRVTFAEVESTPCSWNLALGGWLLNIE
jgi:hypothetical protein